ncbi:MULTISPECIES: hypothetical protein [unclassified Shewanella]|uniref:hypothetical protein n=1 Tax=unclassified Shewanella TaxID=196818 RepID=UPI0026E22BBD|nr:MULTISPECIES: hypothetical protein [unclassified Shewanella]MDO6679149.1 hypothetical protein [Shewanella sp. 4_MG-2023]MDO6777626.1 hypothetical protein [Shewanella sp. 3_MG-2023]
MLDRIEEFSAEYLEKGSGVIWEYSQIGKTIVSPNNDNVRFSLRKIDGSEDIEDFSTIINIEDGEYFIKSDYYQDPSEWYELKVSQDDGEVVFEEEDDEGKLTIFAVVT